MIPEHERGAPGRKQTARAIGRFQKVFGGHDGVMTAVAPHLIGQEGGVVGIGGGDFLRLDEEDATDAVGRFGRLQFAFLEPQEVGRRAHGAQIDGCGVASGAHGRKHSFDVGCVLILGLVDDQQVAGRFAPSGGPVVAADEYDRGVADGVAAGVGGAPPAAARQGRVEALLQPPHAATQPVTHRAVDHLPARALQQNQQVDQQMGDGLVLARLAREDEQELMPAPVQHRIDDGSQGRDLIGIERQTDDEPRKALDVGQHKGGRLAMPIHGSGRGSAAHRST